MVKAYLIGILLLLIQIDLSAQSRAYQFDDVPLVEVIDSLEKDYSTLFSYTSELLSGQVVNKAIIAENLKDVLSQLFNDLDIRFDIIDGNNVLLKAKIKHESMMICGYVFSGYDRSPLAHANIIHPHSGYGTTTDENGFFSFEMETKNKEEIKISYIGFESKSVTLIDDLSAKDCLKIYLNLPETTEAFLVIKDYITDGIELKDQLSSTEINVKNTGSLPGQVEPDVLSMIQFLPGVNSPSAKASDLYIRGCSPDQNLISWEGIPIYHSAHYFGMLSAFNPFTIHSMKIYRGGFDADYGGRIASVIQMDSPDESNRSSYGGIGSNMTHAYAYAHQVFDSNRPASINVSIRRSFQEVWESPTFKNISKVNQQGFIIGNKELSELPDNISIVNDFNFTDAQIKATKFIGEKTKLELAGIYAYNDFNDRIEDKATNSLQEDKYDLRNFGASLKLQTSLSDRFNATWQFISSNYEYDYLYTLTDTDLMRVRVEGQKSNRISDIQFKADNTFKIDASSNLKFGYHLTNYEIDFRVEELSPSQGNNVNDNGEDIAKLHALYFNYTKLIKDRLGFKAGFRSSYFDGSESFYFEPRINLSYKINDQLNFRTNFGWYSQFIGQVTEFRGSDTGFSLPLWAISENKSIPILNSKIFQAGLIYKQNSLTIDLQTYMRRTNGLSSRAYNLLIETPSSKPENGDAEIFGIDLLIKKGFGNYRSWISYAYSKVDFIFNRVSNGSFPSDYDQRHVFQWVNRYKSNRHIFGLGFKVSSGLPYSRLVDFAITSGVNEPLEYQGEYEGINTSRLDYNYELNLSYEYQFNITEGLRGYLIGSIRNIFNRENIFERDYTVRASGTNSPQIISNDKSNLLFTPNITARIEW